MSITIRAIQQLLTEHGYPARRCRASEPDLYELSIRHRADRTAKIRIAVHRNNVCYVVLYAWSHDGSCRQSSPLQLKFGHPDFNPLLLKGVESLATKPVIFGALDPLSQDMDIHY